MRAKMPLWHAHLHMTAHRPRRNRLSSPINGPSARHASASRRFRPRRPTPKSRSMDPVCARMARPDQTTPR